MANLVTRREIRPGVYREQWEEDGFLYSMYRDTARTARMDYRKRMRAVHPKISRDCEGLYPVGHLEQHEQDELERRFPALADPDVETAQKAWKRFWQSSVSEPYRVVDRV